MMIRYKNKNAVAGGLVVLVALAVIFAFTAVKNNALLYSRRVTERDLTAARTTAEERAAFDRIARKTRVHFACFDAAGAQVAMSSQDWFKRAAVIRFYQFGDPPLDHTLIDTANIIALMGE
jgi:hypothetical protein